MNPDHLTREQARAMVMEWCTAEPVPGEVYCVWTQGLIYRYPQIWVMQKCSTHSRLFTFNVHSQGSLSPTKDGVRLITRYEPTQTTVRKARWMTLRAKGSAVYSGQEIAEKC